MKITLITISMLALIATSSTADEIPSPVYSWEWSKDGAYIIDPGWEGSFSYIPGNDYATFGDGVRPYSTHFTEIQRSFTVSFDVKRLTSTLNQWNNVFTLYSNNTTSGDNNRIALEFNEVGGLELYGVNRFGYTVTLNTGLTWNDLTEDQWRNLCIIFEYSSATLSVYVDGELVDSSTGWFPSDAPTGAQFGSAFGDTRIMDGTMDINNIKFYNGAVLPVPEPATASLSLIGLAALMMRRRRF